MQAYANSRCGCTIDEAVEPEAAAVAEKAEGGKVLLALCDPGLGKTRLQQLAVAQELQLEEEQQAARAEPPTAAAAGRPAAAAERLSALPTR